MIIGRGELQKRVYLFIMEAGAQYALHDNEETSLWAARVRLTPELLDKLRNDPQQILLKLNVFGGDGVSRTRNSNKKTSLMTVKLAGTDAEETVEQYELLSFPEDPGINHICSFQRENAGYTVHKTGAIHQKLLVQRLLDATEKDRIKDKHAKSVLASKSRSSKLIETEPEAPAKRQRVTTRMSRVPTTRMSTGTSAWSKTTGPKHHGRSVILDDSDYDSFVEMHEQFRHDWEMLDKAYSIEMIKTEGLHLQLEVATTDADREQLEAKIEASSSKKEGLLFVRDSMTSIQKILHSIQVSIYNFDLKHGTY
ncbi:hypothetical protein BBP00_00009564 [Phytophthora kernoviae]|uniref:Uncharacterized protein n=1 Tax=Phytophthora kernoviae TaxID=325452 RepID=A0A3F2RE58_9STRA|nr:hypothetical protein BBP00_00009564 [Phytophthora kernoviae]